MKVPTLVAAVVLLGATSMFASIVASDGPLPAGVASPSTSSDNQDTPAMPPSNPASPPAQSSNPAVQPTNPAPPASSQNVTAGAAPLRVMVGKSLLINTTERLKRVSVTDPTVADALVVTPTQVLVNGLVSRRSFATDLGRTGAVAQLRSPRGCRYHCGFGRNASPFPGRTDRSNAFAFTRLFSLAT